MRRQLAIVGKPLLGLLRKLSKTQRIFPSQFMKEEEASPSLMVDVTNVIDTEKIQILLDDFFREAEILVGAVVKKGQYDVGIESGKASPKETELWSLASKTLDMCSAQVDFEKIPHESKKAALEKQLGEASDEERITKYIEENAEAISREISRKGKPLSKLKILERDRDHARSAKEEAEALRDKVCKAIYGGFAPVKNPLRRVYWLIILALLPVEAILNYVAMDSLPDGDLPAVFIIPVAATLSVMIAGGGHFVGSFLAGKVSKWLVLAMTSTVLLLIGIVFYLRFGGAQSAFILTFINVAILIFVTALSYYRHKGDAFFIPDNEASRQGKQEVRLEKKIADIKNKVESDRQGVLDSWNEKARKVVEEETKAIREKIAASEELIAKFDNFLQTKVISPIEAKYQDAVCRLRVNIITARAKNKLDPVSMDFAISPLSTHGAIHKHISIEKESQNGRAKVKSGILPILMALYTMGLMSCSGETPPSVFKEIVYIPDQSIQKADSAALPSLEDQVSFLFSSLEFEPYENPMAISTDALRVRVVPITNTSFPPMNIIELEGINDPIWAIVKSQRRAAQNHLVEQTRQVILEEGQAQGLSYSYVVSTFCQVLPDLAQSDAQIRQVFIVSDLVLNNPDMKVNFYRLGASLSRDYESVVETLENYCPDLKSMRLDGAQITAVYLPRSDDHIILKHTRNFWQRYFDSKGAEIQFLPNVPKAQNLRAAQQNHSF